jgi:hypothetical protein
MRIINSAKYLLLLVLIGSLCSCEKSEIGIPKPVPVPTNAITSQVSIGATYQYQVFFDLETNKAVSQNSKFSWDVAFEASADGYHVILNNSKSSFAYNSGTNNFETADTAGHLKTLLYDVSSGNLDSTAIGDWRTDKNVYFINLGKDADGANLGYKKLQIISVDATSFVVKMASLDGSNLVQKTIMKDSAYNFMFITLSAGDLITVEPPKDTWDVVFTQYTTIFYDPGFLPYSVTGCLLNRYQTTGARDSLTDFTVIDLDFVKEATLTPAIDIVGYDWKEYTGVYITNPKMIYFIKNRHGIYYKLHFKDFYNQAKEKGNPLFEFQELQ